MLLLLSLHSLGQGTVFDGSQYVNQVTGQFNYQVPLIELPVPGGQSFPVSLSYRSGVTVDMEPSWVGLGWDLEVGSIQRQVAGVPDDWVVKAVQYVTVIKDGNDNLVVSDLSGINRSPKNMIRNNTMFNNDSQRKLNRLSSMQLVRDLEESIIFSSNFKLFPERWFDGSRKIQSIGALNRNLSSSFFGSPSNSQYYIPNFSQDVVEESGIRSSSFNSNSFTLPNFQMPAFDKFICNTPLISGVFSAHYADKHVDVLVNQNKEIDISSNTYQSSITTNGMTDLYNKTTSHDYDFSANFIFKSDGSGYYRNLPGSLYFTPTSSSQVKDSTTFHLPSNFSHNRSLLQSVISEKNGQVSVNSSNRKLVQKNYIEWATNLEMSNLSSNNVKRMLECPEMQNRRLAYETLIQNSNIPNAQKEIVTDPDGIGAFKITDENGLTFHFCLPVYDNEIVAFSLNPINQSETQVSGSFNFNKSANAWHLTAITGPDFVDVNNNNVVDDADAGYWIKFNYGLWSNGFVWRSPRSGYHETIHNSSTGEYTSSFSYGRKQIYYLNSIESKSHSLLFVKELRYDYPSIEQLYYPVKFSQFNLPYNYDHGNSNQYQLRLKKIYLIEKSKLQSINISTINSSPLLASSQKVARKIKIVTTFGTQYLCDLVQYSYNLSNNVLDVNDLVNKAEQLDDNSIKSIDLVANYSLRTGTNFGAFVNYISPNPNPSSGCLTLKSLKMNSINNQEYESLTFEYLNNPVLSSTSAKNDWGFLSNNQSAWSLTSLSRKNGLKVSMEYEDNYYSKILFPEVMTNNTIVNVMAGGIRVSSISLIANNEVLKTQFEYLSQSNTLSSGVLFHTPGSRRNIPFSFMYSSSQVFYEYVRVKYINSINQLERSTLNRYIVPHLTSFASVASNDLNAVISIDKVFSGYQSFEDRGRQKISTTTIHDRSSHIGLPLSSHIYDNNGNLVSKNEIYYHFSSPEKTPTGLFQESYLSSKFLIPFHHYFMPNQNFSSFTYYDYPATRLYELVNLSSIVSYAPVVEKIVSFDNASSRKQTIFFTDYDISTGKPHKVRTLVDGQPELINSQTLAYSHFPSLSSKVWDINNTNQLTLPGSSITSVGDKVYSASSNVIKFGYFKRELNSLGYLGWHFVSQSNALSSEQFVLNVPSDINGFVSEGWSSFNYSQLQFNDAHWKLSSSILKVNIGSLPLETKDTRGIVSSYRYHPSMKLPVSTASNANYATSLHDGFENFIVDDVFLPPSFLYQKNNQALDIKPHSGIFYLERSGSTPWVMYKQKFNPDGSGIPRGVWMEASIWSHVNSAPFQFYIRLIGQKENCTTCIINTEQIVASASVNPVPPGKWRRLKVMIFIPEDYISLANNTTQHLEVGISPSGSGTIYVDDLMIRPSNSSLNALVYDDYLRVQYEIDKDNYYTRYFYDHRNRVIKTVRETEKGIYTLSENAYND